MGMDWLASCHANVDYRSKIVQFQFLEEPVLEWKVAEHADHLPTVLRVLQKGKLYAKFSKCEFWLNYVFFLRHIISGEGIRVDTQKIEAVKTWPRPTTPTEALKDRLTSAPVLTLPEETDGYVIYCDASSVGLGCVLMQHDHKSLQYVFKKKDLNIRQRRRLELLKDYDVDILYHTWMANVVADTLSSRSTSSLSYIQPKKRGIAHEIHQLDSLGVRLLDSGDIGTIQDMATTSLVTEVKERQYEGHMLVHYRYTTPQKEKTPFEITEDGDLRYRGRLCVPNVARLRRQVMGETHYSLYSIHPGATKMYHDIREVYWWNEMEKDIAEFVA
ncbi:uncharacterized protein [Nicotiana sylvestris]|uniref:uncharacterized protein n=1 Tax=Nicotiana sylvestris TaxID=4096 RepID=UPI00388C82CB